MSRKPIQEFIDCLHYLEETRDARPMVSLFADQCELGNVSIRPLHGRAGAARFWADYRAAFERVETRFVRVSEAGGRAFLEWISQGRLRTGSPVVYSGLTVLEFDGDTRRELISRLKGYHDSAVFLREGGKHLDRLAA